MHLNMRECVAQKSMQIMIDFLHTQLALVRSTNMDKNDERFLLLVLFFGFVSQNVESELAH